MKTRLLVFRLRDPFDNKESLMVYLREDNTLSYSLYTGWQENGISIALSSLQLKKSLPLSIEKYKKNVYKLKDEISDIIRTGTDRISDFEILNTLK